MRRDPPPRAFVEDLAYFRGDMERVENMHGFGTFLTEDLQVGFPDI
jgi:hypothetical protein